MKLHVGADERLRVVHQLLRPSYGLRQVRQVLFGPPLGEQRRARRLDEGPGVVDVLTGWCRGTPAPGRVAGGRWPAERTGPVRPAGRARRDRRARDRRARDRRAAARSSFTAPYRYGRSRQAPRGSISRIYNSNSLVRKRRAGPGGRLMRPARGCPGQVRAAAACLRRAVPPPWPCCGRQAPPWPTRPGACARTPQLPRRCACG